MVSSTAQSQSLWDKYKTEITKNLLISCGLDAILYGTHRPDQTGGHVDTTRYVRENGEFKNIHHKESYKNRGDYDSRAVHTNPDFIKRGKEGKAQHRAGYVSVDYATGHPINQNQKPNLDHVNSGKMLHDDKTRSGLTNLETDKLAANKHNLYYTSETINKSKGKKSPEEFAKYCEKKQSLWQNTVSQLEKTSEHRLLTEKENKELKKTKELLNVDPITIRQQGKKSEKYLNRQIDINYYTSKDFWQTTGVSALKGGGMMALRQGFGFILMAGWEEISLEWPHLIQKWEQNADNLLDKIKIAYTHIKNALSRAFKKLKENASELLKTIFQGFTNGLLADFTTVIIDIFAGTLKSFMRMIRNLWSTIIEAINTLRNHSLPAKEKTEAILKIFAIGIGPILQPIIAETISQIPALGQIPVISTILKEFIGGAIGGIISVSLLHFIENSPIAQKVLDIITKAGEITYEVLQQISHVISVSPEYLFASHRSFLLMAGAAFTFGPIGITAVIGGQMMLAPVHEKLDKLNAEIEKLATEQENIFATLSGHIEDFQQFKQKSYKYFMLLVEGQEKQYQALHTLETTMAEGFTQTRESLNAIPEKTLQLFADHHLQDRMDCLNGYLRNIEDSLNTELPRTDLEESLKLASEIRSKMEREWERQHPASPARFPLLLSAIFALAAEYRARLLLKDNLNAALSALKRWRNMAKQEALALMQNASFYQIVTERSVLAGQYAAAFRLMKNSEMPKTLFQMIAWDDGLGEARALLMAADSKEPNWQEFPLITAQNRREWQKLAQVPRGEHQISFQTFQQTLGMPKNLSLPQEQAEEIAMNGAHWLENAKKQLRLSLSETI